MIKIFKLLGLPSLVVQFIRGQFWIWHLQLLDLYKREDHFLITTWLVSCAIIFTMAENLLRCVSLDKA